MRFNIKTRKEDNMKNEIITLDEKTIRDRIVMLRGQEVLLDFDLAEIYGYTTKNFNRQVKNNIEKFDEDFMFRLEKDDLKELSRCKNCTLNKNVGRGSNFKYMPYAFTEQGIYMLMTGPTPNMILLNSYHLRF